MESKTIKISEKNYRWLLNIAAELQKRKGNRMTFDDALEELKEKGEDIMKSAGAWKDISDKEWAETKRSLKRGWDKWKMKSA